MIDVDVSFINISANNNDNNNNSPLGQNFGQILAEFQPNFQTWAIIGEFYNFGQIFKLLNIISDQCRDCNAIIDHYTHMAVHRLDQNCV